MNELDELYVLSRRVLLDALDALGSHRNAIVLVGAQAVYLRVGEADLAVAPFTTDGDLAIDPAILTGIPPLENALIEAGFVPKAKDSVGIWITSARRMQTPKRRSRLTCSYQPQSVPVRDAARPSSRVTTLAQPAS